LAKNLKIIYVNMKRDNSTTNDIKLEGGNLGTIDDILKAPLSNKIKNEYNTLINLLHNLTKSQRSQKTIMFTGGLASPSDVIAYQIGWGKRVIDWSRNQTSKI
jgi:hypothetical protein